MTDNRNWRSAKPRWIVDAALKEMDALRRTASLRWPNEPKPEPVPFRWGEYDRVHGNPEPGTYYVPEGYHSTYAHAYVKAVRIRKRLPDETDLGPSHRHWVFAEGDATRWTTNVYRGDLYRTERDAALACLWLECERAASRLEQAWALFDAAGRTEGEQ